jgi:hypothetical protein
MRDYLALHALYRQCDMHVVEEEGEDAAESLSTTSLLEHLSKKLIK